MSSTDQRNSYSIYFAGGLFDHKQLMGNAILARYIESVSNGKYIVNLPQDIEVPIDRAAHIRNEDLLHVMKNDLAIFNFDGTELDSGTVVEMMFAKLLDIPAVILRTDFRNGGDVKDGDPWNLMCSAYPRTQSLVLHSMVWYQDARQAAGSQQELEEILYTRMAKAVIEKLDEVLQEKPVSHETVDVQELYKWALHFPGAGLQDTPHSVLRSVLRRKMAKGLLPTSRDFIPAHAQRLNRLFVQLGETSRRVAVDVPSEEFVLNGATLNAVERIWTDVLALDRDLGDALEAYSVLSENSDDNGVDLSPLRESASAVRLHSARIKKSAEVLLRQIAFESRYVCDCEHVAAQESLLDDFVSEVKRVVDDIVVRGDKEFVRAGI
jgi:nucleoside 2-deoxyribosyltransferase